jgi:hypothetical protein
MRSNNFTKTKIGTHGKHGVLAWYDREVRSDDQIELDTHSIFGRSENKLNGSIAMIEIHVPISKQSRSRAGPEVRSFTSTRDMLESSVQGGVVQKAKDVGMYLTK